jgi:hypothetical protein
MEGMEEEKEGMRMGWKWNREALKWEQSESGSRKHESRKN